VFADTEPVTIFQLSNRLVMVVDGNGGAMFFRGSGVSGAIRIFGAVHPYRFFRILQEKLGWGLPHMAKPTSVELP